MVVVGAGVVVVVLVLVVVVVLVDVLVLVEVDVDVLVEVEVLVDVVFGGCVVEVGAAVVLVLVDVHGGGFDVVVLGAGVVVVVLDEVVVDVVVDVVVLVVVEVGSPLQHWQATSSSMRMMQGACFASRSRNTSLPGEVPVASASFTRASPE